MLFPAHQIISMGGADISIGDWYLESIVTDPSDASCIFTLSGDNKVRVTDQNGVNVPSPYRILACGHMSQYEVFASRSNTNIDGTFGTWISLGSGPSWSCTATNKGQSKSGTVTLNVRRTATGAIVATAVITMFAEVQI